MGNVSDAIESALTSTLRDSSQTSSKTSSQASSHTSSQTSPTPSLTPSLAPSLTSPEDARKDLEDAFFYNIVKDGSFLPEGYTIEFSDGHFNIKSSAEDSYVIQSFISERYAGNRNILMQHLNAFEDDSLKKLVMSYTPHYFMLKRQDSRHHTSQQCSPQHIQKWFMTLAAMRTHLTEEGWEDILTFAKRNHHTHRILFDPFSFHILASALERIQQVPPDDTDCLFNKFFILLEYVPNSSPPASPDV